MKIRSGEAEILVMSHHGEYIIVKCLPHMAAPVVLIKDVLVNSTCAERASPQVIRLMYPGLCRYP